MPPCCVINKNSEKHCGNWALKGKSCCWVHRALEDSPIPTEREVLVDEAMKRLESDEYRCVSICRNGKRCSRFFNICNDDGKRLCGQHWIMVMNQKDRDNSQAIVKGNQDSGSDNSQDSDNSRESESDTDSDYDPDNRYYAHFR